MIQLRFHIAEIPVIDNLLFIPEPNLLEEYIYGVPSANTFLLVCRGLTCRTQQGLGPSATVPAVEFAGLVMVVEGGGGGVTGCVPFFFLS